MNVKIVISSRPNKTSKYWYNVIDGLNNSYQIVSGAKKKKSNYRIDLDKYNKTLFGAKYLTKTQRLDGHDFDIFFGDDI